MSNTDFGYTRNQEDVKAPDANLPDGDYPLKAVEAERKASSKDARNWYLKVAFDVIGGPAVGRKHFQNYNVGHTTESVKEMALDELVRFAKAINYTGPLNKFDPFLNQPFTATIKNTPQKDDKDKTNSNIRKYAPIGSFSAAPVVNVAPAIVQVAAPAASVAANTPAPAPGTAPWGAQKAA
jgi:hypothetical protein